MHIVVCLRPAVPAAAVTYDPHTGAPRRPVDTVLGTRDAVALQTALDLRHAGGRVTALAVADERADPLLHHALRSGAGRAIRIWHSDGGAPLDSWAAATTAAAALVRLEADLTLCASHSDDLANGYFPAVLATGAGCALLSRVVSLVATAGGVEAVEKLERGWRARSATRLPAVAAVEPELARLRHQAVLGRVYRTGLGRPIEVWGPAELGLPALPAPLLEEVELTLPRARARAAPAAAVQLSAKDRLRRKKPAAAEAAAEPVSWDGPVDRVAKQLLERMTQWLQ